MLVSLGERRVRNYLRVDKCFCNQSGGGGDIHLLHLSHMITAAIYNCTFCETSC